MSSPFSLHAPCPGCPFRNIDHEAEAVRHLSEERMESIIDGGSFPCHRTVPDTGGPEGGQEMECAGFLIYHLANHTPTQMMRSCGRLGMIDADALLANESMVETDRDALLELQHSDRPSSRFR